MINNSNNEEEIERRIELALKTQSLEFCECNYCGGKGGCPSPERDNNGNVVRDLNGDVVLWCEDCEEELDQKI